MKSDQTLQTLVAQHKLPVHKVAHLAQLLADLGGEASAITLALKRCGMNAEMLANANAYISAQQSLAFIRSALALSQRAELGLLAGQSSSASACGLMGYAMSCAATVRDAAEIVIKYQQASPALAQLMFREENQQAVFQLQALWPLADLQPFVCEEIFASSLNIFTLLTGVAVEPVVVRFAYRQPDYSEHYSQLFNAPLSFDAPVSELIVPASYLELPIISRNPVAENMAKTLCAQHIFQLSNADQLIQRVRFELLLTPGHFPAEEQVAERLAMTARSLRRKLKEQGFSFQKILDSVRQQLALEYLENTSLPLEDIAALSGFSDASNFRRAFKRWTNRLPSEVRKSAQQPAKIDA